MKSPKPYSVGRIVMYVPHLSENVESRGNLSDLLPAIVVQDWKGNEAYQEQSSVNLKVFTDGPVDLWRTSVPYSEEKTPGTWPWPEIK